MVLPLWKTIWQFLKKLYKITIWHRNSISRNMPKELKTYWNKHMCEHVHSSIIHNSHKMKAAQMSIRRRMDHQTVVYTYSVILFSHNRNYSYKLQHGWNLKTLSERSQSRKVIYYAIPFVWHIHNIRHLHRSVLHIDGNKRERRGENRE